jgi:hypothetical protein
MQEGDMRESRDTCGTGSALGRVRRQLNNQGKISWKATPRFLAMLADAERDAEDDLDDFP